MNSFFFLSIGQLWNSRECENLSETFMKSLFFRETLIKKSEIFNSLQNRQPFVSEELRGRCSVTEMATEKFRNCRDQLKESWKVRLPAGAEVAAVTVVRTMMTRPSWRTATARSVSLQVGWLCRRGASPMTASFLQMNSLLKRLIRLVISPETPAVNDHDRR